MGAWGPGLYATDFAVDLKGTIAVLARLPLRAERLLDMLVETAPAQGMTRSTRLFGWWRPINSPRKASIVARRGRGRCP